MSVSTLLKGTAFITGAASGIGQATAIAFARHGIKNLALADIDTPTLEASNKALKAKYPGVNILALKVDTGKINTVEAAISQTVARFGRLDVAVNNAGVAGNGLPTHEQTEADWRRVVNINLDGVWRCQLEEIKVMLKQEDLGVRQGRGRIINMASMFGVVGPTTAIMQTAYTAAKHGVVGLTKADSSTYGPKNIRINAICPGYVATPLLAAGLKADADGPLARDIARTPFQRLVLVEEIADAISFLASEMSSGMQGAALVSDAGWSIQ